MAINIDKTLHNDSKSVEHPRLQVLHGLSHGLKPLKTCAPMGRPFVVFHKACSSAEDTVDDIVNTMGIYFINLLIVVFNCVFLLLEFERQN